MLKVPYGVKRNKRKKNEKRHHIIGENKVVKFIKLKYSVLLKITSKKIKKKKIRKEKNQITGGKLKITIL